jgi:hypothetical protein
VSTQIQYRRGTSAENDSFTGALGEVTVDTTLNSLRVSTVTTPKAPVKLSFSADVPRLY